ncbi:MAG: methyl-accepting chemotaxis protein, partial [Polyangiaceae bacterium]
ASGIAQIHQALSQIDGATRQSATAARDMAGASEQLSQRVGRLRHLLGLFTLAKADPPRPDATARTSTPRRASLRPAQAPA